MLILHSSLMQYLAYVLWLFNDLMIMEKWIKFWNHPVELLIIEPV